MMSDQTTIQTDELKHVIEALQQGEVICYPTEAVYGLGCDPHQVTAVKKLLEIKQRPWQKGLILISGSVQHFEPLLKNLTDQQRQSIESSWPGHVTWVLPDVDEVYSQWIKGTHSSVAVRVSKHPLIKQVTDAFEGPVVSTSANVSSEPAIYDLEGAKAFVDATETDWLLEDRKSVV